MSDNDKASVKYVNDRFWTIVAVFVVGIIAQVTVTNTQISALKVEMAKWSSVVELMKEGKLKITETKDKAKDETTIDHKRIKMMKQRLLSMAE